MIPSTRKYLGLQNVTVSQSKRRQVYCGCMASLCVGPHYHDHGNVEFYVFQN